MERKPDGKEYGETFVISIVMATFNAGEYLQNCLDSIAAQKAEGIEILIMDGGSSDQTISIIEKSMLPGLKWFSEPDRGIYDALNKGAEKASGRWLYFLGADDRLLPGFSELVSNLQLEDTVYYGLPEGYFEGEKEPDFILLGGKFSAYKMAKYCLNHQVIMYPSSVFQKYQYQLKYPVLADYALNIQVWGDRSFKKVFVALPVALYNMTGYSSFTKDKMFEKDKPDLIRQSLGLIVYWRWRFKKWKKKIRGETF